VLVGAIFGKRDVAVAEQERIIETLGEIFLPAIETQVQNVALLLAQITAGFAIGGLDSILGLFGGKRNIAELDLAEQVRILQTLETIGVTLLETVVIPTLPHLLTGLLGLLGKRDAEQERVLEAIQTVLQQVGPILGQVLVGAIFGKRDVAVAEEERILQTLEGIFLPAIETQVQNVALLLAQITAGFAIGGLDSILGLFGKRNIAELDLAEQERIIETLEQVGVVLLENVLPVALQILPGLLIGLFGKRDV